MKKDVRNYFFVLLFAFSFLFLIFSIFSINLVSAGLIASSGKIVSDGPLYDINLEDSCGRGEYCYGDSFCSDYSDSWDCESNGCTWVMGESGDCGVASIYGHYNYDAQWNFKNDKGNKTGSATISYNNINYNIQCINGVNCTKTITSQQGSFSYELDFPLEGYFFNNNSGWFIDFFSLEFECTMGLCGGSASNVQENLNTSKAVVKDSYYSDKVVRDFKFSAKGEQECGVVNHGSSDFCNYEAQVSETWVPDVQFIEASCYLDPEYIQKTYDKRLFKPTEITPFDDIICEAKLRVNPHLPQFTTKPKLKGELLTLDEQGNWSVLITETKDFMNYIGTNYSVKIGPFNPLLTEQMTPTYDFDVYQWKIKGWYKEAFKEGFNIMGIEGFGWAPNQETLNKLVTNSRVYSNNIRFFVSVFEEKSNNLSRDFSTYNCVHIWGKEDADFSFGIIALSSAKFSPRGIVWMAIEIKKQAIDFISPFREYPQTFSYYADLATVAEEDFVFDTEFLKKLEYFISAPDLKKVTEMSSCSSDYYILISGGEKHYSGYVRYVQQNVVNLNVDRSHSFYATLLHEFGHSFVKLEDEYSFEEIGKISRLPNLGLIRFFVNQFGISGKNCRLEPNWGNYGNYLIPCGIYSFNKRPSLNSLMNSPNKVPFLNVVSCGYILQKMGKCSNINSCWEMCANPDWNTLKSEQQFCGEYLFNPLTQKCCSNRANNQDYLFPDKGCCGEPGNQIGFDSSTEECCIKEGIGSTGEACCGEEGKQISYSPSSQKCCPDGSVIDLKGDCTDKNQNILLVPIIDV